MICVVCEKNGIKSKEHVFPTWLILRTNTHKTAIKWVGGKSINPKKATLPICGNCNKKLGDALEGPVQKIFERIENGGGINDYDAELLIKWMWKISKLFWAFNNTKGKVMPNGTLLEHLLMPIQKPRERLTLAISLFEENDKGFIDLPMGNDIQTLHSGVLAAGVYSKIAIIVSLTEFAGEIPHYYSKYTLAKERGKESEPRLMIPHIGIKNRASAIKLTKETTGKLWVDHEMKALETLIVAKKLGMI